MVSAREIMQNDVAVVGADESLVGAAQKMRDLHVGALPVLDANEEFLGIITDRDIVVRCVADGHDPLATIAQELVHTEPIWVYADSDIVDVLDTMEQNKVRRVPVLEDHQRGQYCDQPRPVTGRQLRCRGVLRAAQQLIPATTYPPWLRGASVALGGRVVSEAGGFAR
jgi:CBS domain-containing protein